MTRSRLLCSLLAGCLIGAAWTLMVPASLAADPALQGAAAPAEGLQTAEPPARPVASSRTVILLRHAEKGSDDRRDPSLSEAGEARARALARLLSKAGVTQLFASEYKRTQATLAPLAAALDVPVVAHPASDSAGLVRRLRALPPGSVAVVAGHSNTVPELAAALGAALPALSETPRGAMLAEEEYDRLFVLSFLATPAPGAPALLELRYGDD